MPNKLSPGWFQSFRQRLAGKKLFMFTVILPTALAGLYYGLIASDIYISESSFVIRSPQRQISTGLGAFLQGAGFSRSQEDSCIVQDFMLSRDALRQLDRQLNLAKSYGSGKVDPVSRFAALNWENDFENLHRYYKKKVEINLDSASSITTLRVKAFTAEDAYRINELLLEISDRLVNRLNERAWQDTISFAAADVAQAEAKARDATLAVSSFRNREGVYDPDRQSVFQLQQTSKLQEDLISAKTQLSQIRSIARDNPQIPALEKRIETLQAEINSETVKMAGSRNSLSSKAARTRGGPDKQHRRVLSHPSRDPGQGVRQRNL